MPGDQRKSAPTTFDGQGLTDEAIRQQLALILTSPEFSGKPTVASFLRFVVEEALAGRAHQIKGYTIATQALGRKDSFDAGKDAAVRIAAGRVRAALESYYFRSGSQDSVRIEVPRGTYIPVFHLHPVRAPQQGLPWQVRSEKDELSMSRGPGIAILPLRNLSDDPQQEYFADGLTEELTAELARYEDLRVVAAHSTMRLKRVRISAREVGMNLNVRFFLEGSVRKGEDYVKIAVRLIDTTTQTHIWGEQYRRDLRVDNLIQIEEEIAANVAGKIGGYFGVIPRKLARESRGKAPEDLETYEAFLRMHQYSLSISKETFCVALEALEHAHRRDPASGTAWAMLANLYADNNTLWLTAPIPTMEEALAYARRGVLVAPQNQYAHTMLAHLHFLVDQRDDFFREAELAVGLNPNSPMHTAFLGWDMALYGEWDRGQRLMERGIELNPYYPGWFHLAPYLYHFSEGRYEEAYQEALKFQSPQLFWDPLLRAAILGELDRLDEARVAVTELLRLKTDFPSCAKHLIGFYVKAEDQIQGLLDGLSKAGLTI
jgi:adenylate cyclase